MPQPDLFLASRSPRRARLLRDAGYQLQQVVPPYEDPAQPPYHQSASAQDLAEQLARQKLLSALAMRQLAPTRGRHVVISADTICLGPAGELIGQPQTPHEAKQMLASFADRTHQVLTAVALAAPGQDVRVFVDTADVQFGPIGCERLTEYLATDRWRGKAGGYNLVERQAAGWPITVCGDPSTVVGLPMVRLRPLLAQVGIVPSPPPKR